MECPNCGEEMSKIFYFLENTNTYLVQLTCSPCRVCFSGTLEKVEINGKETKQVLRDSDISV